MAAVGGTVETKFVADVSQFTANIGKVKAALADMVRAIKSAGTATDAASAAMKNLSTDSARAIRVAAGEAKKLQKAMADVSAIAQQGRSGSILDNAALRQSLAIMKSISSEMAAMRAAGGVNVPIAPTTKVPKPSQNLPIGPAGGAGAGGTGGGLAKTAKDADAAGQSLTRLQKVTSSLSGYFSQGITQAAGFSQALRGMQFVGTALGGAFIALQAAKKLVDWGGDAAKIEDAKRVMQSMGFSIAEMREKTKGLLSDQQLAKGFGLASSMGITANQFQKFAIIADAAAKKMGITQEYAFESLVKGASRSSARWLDNAGIAVQWSKAHQDAAKQLGKTVRELSNAEKKQAELNQVMSQGEKIVREVRGVNATTSDSYDQFLASVSNLADNLKTVLIPAMETAADVAKWLNTSLESAMNKDMRSSVEVLGSALGLQAKAIEFSKRALSEGRVSGDLGRAITDSAILVQIERDLNAEKAKGKNANALMIANLTKSKSIVTDLISLTNLGSAAFGRYSDRIAIATEDLAESRKTLALTGQGFIEDLANRSRGRIESEEESAAAQRRAKEVADRRLAVEEKITEELRKQKSESAIAAAAFGAAVERPFQELKKTLSDIAKMVVEAQKAGGGKLQSNLANLTEQTGLVIREFGNDLGKAVKDQKSYADAQAVFVEAQNKLNDVLLSATDAAQVAAVGDASKALKAAHDVAIAALDEEARKRGDEMRQKYDEKIADQKKKEEEAAKRATDAINGIDEKLRSLRATVPAVEQSIVGLDRAFKEAADFAKEGATPQLVQQMQMRATELFVEEMEQARRGVSSFAEAKAFDSAVLSALDTKIVEFSGTLPEAAAALIEFSNQIKNTQIDAADVGRQMAIGLKDDTLTNALAVRFGEMFTGINRALGISDAGISGVEGGIAQLGGTLVGGAISGDLSASSVGAAIGTAAGGPIGAQVGAAVGEGIAQLVGAVTDSISSALPQEAVRGMGAAVSGLYGMMTGPLFLGPLASLSSAMEIANLSRGSPAGKRAELAMEAASRRIAEAAAPAADMLLALADVSSRAISPLVGMLANNRAVQEMVFNVVKTFAKTVIMVADWFDGTLFDTDSSFDLLYADIDQLTFDEAIASGSALADEQERLTKTTSSLNDELRNLPTFFNVNRARANASLSGVAGNPMGRIVEGSTVIIQNASFNGVQDLDGLAAQLNTRARQALLRSNKPAGIATLTGRG